MAQWPSTRASRVLAALLRIGWSIKRQSGSHRTLQRQGWADVVFAFHDSDEIGPRMLARIAKHTGLKPEDL
jgi:predicted RNA binding protein YcfA (HicA-like mRNA interferase family)